MVDWIELKFQESNDGSGDGELCIFINGLSFCCFPITHTGQKEIIYDLIGMYKKFKLR